MRAEKLRRKLLKAIAASPAVTWCGVLRAQPKTRRILIGWLNSASRKANIDFLVAFKEGMTAFGWQEGVTYDLEERWAEGRTGRVYSLAEEFKSVRVDIFVTAGRSATRAAAAAVPNTPIVQANGSSPVAAGLASSLARPGGMVTGVTNIAGEHSEKRLELLLDALPTIKRVAFLIDKSSANHEAVLKVARRSIQQYRIEGKFGEIVKADDIEPVIARLANEGAQALVIMPGTINIVERLRIVIAATSRRLPVVGGGAEVAEAGALLSYGVNNTTLYRRAAYYVDRILKGAKPGDLPIEQPTTFELVINLKTAKALGLSLSRELFVRADRIIE